MTQQDDLQHVGAWRLAEAQSLFDLNQRRRSRAEAILVLAAVMAFLAGLVAAVTDDDIVLLPVAPLALALTSLSLQHYAEVTVLGAARAILERAVNDAYGRTALVYESYVADIRNNGELASGVLVLQIIAVLAIGGAIVAGGFVAATRPQWQGIGYALATAATALSCLGSYTNMRHSARIAQERLLGLSSAI